jgi:hypothetical protein
MRSSKTTVCLVPAVVALLVLLASSPRDAAVGDAPDYVLMMLSWAKNSRPYVDRANSEMYNEVLDASGIRLRSETWTDEWNSVFLDDQARCDCQHFWFYSLLASLPYQISSLFTPQVYWGFWVVHAALALVVLGAARRLFSWQGAWAFLFLWIYSPALWFGAKIHTEFFTFCVTTLFIMFVLKRRFMWAAFSLALASTQNPVFSPMCVALVGWFVLSRIRHGIPRGDVLLIAATATVVGIHPIYYLIRWKVLNPQFLASGANMESRSLADFLIPLFDLNLGLFPNWLLGGILVALVPWLIPSAQWRRHAPALGVVAVFILVSLWGASKTTNYVHGGTVHITRYSAWLLCLFFPLFLALIRRVSVWHQSETSRGTNAWVASVVVVIAVAGTLAAYQFWPTRKTDYLYPTRAASFVLASAPRLYNPAPEIFIERHVFHDEVRFDGWIAGSQDGRKLLVYPARMPKPVGGLNRIPGVGGRVDPREFEKFFKKFLDAHQHWLSRPWFYVNIPDSAAAKIYHAPLLRSGQIITGQVADNRFFYSGWHDPGEPFRWSSKAAADIRFVWIESTPPAALHFEFRSFVPPDRQVAHELILNGRSIWKGAIDATSAASGLIEVSVPQDLIRPKKENELVFQTSPVRIPANFDGESDERPLGIGFRVLHFR